MAVMKLAASRPVLKVSFSAPAVVVSQITGLVMVTTTVVTSVTRTQPAEVELHVSTLCLCCFLKCKMSEQWVRKVWTSIPWIKRKTINICFYPCTSISKVTEKLYDSSFISTLMPFCLLKYYHKKWNVVLIRCYYYFFWLVCEENRACLCVGEYHPPYLYHLL